MFLLNSLHLGFLYPECEVEGGARPADQAPVEAGKGRGQDVCRGGDQEQGWCDRLHAREVGAAAAEGETDRGCAYFW